MEQMPEELHLWIGCADEFDRLIHDAAPQASAVTFASKHNATERGRGAAVLAFSSLVKGEVVNVQAVVTVTLLKQAFVALTAAHPTDPPALDVRFRRFVYVGNNGSRRP